jgi:large subunit ribosomal protein L32
MVNHMRHTRSHTANRRSHHALSEARLSRCTNCNAEHVRHTLCPQCGQYRGRQVMDAAGAAQKRSLRQTLKQEQIRQDTGAPAAPEEEAKQ